VRSSWVVEGDVSSYRLGDRAHGLLDQERRSSVGARLSS
jgi:hypothetical protein